MILRFRGADERRLSPRFSLVSVNNSTNGALVPFYIINYFTATFYYCVQNGTAAQYNQFPVSVAGNIIIINY